MHIPAAAALLATAFIAATLPLAAAVERAPARSRPVVVDTASASRIVGVAELTHVVGECSGAGGEHLYLRMRWQSAGPSVGLVHAGGHAFYRTTSTLGDALRIGALVVVDVAAEDAPPIENPGWCLWGLPATTGEAALLSTVGTLDEGIAVVRGLARPR